MMASYFPLCGGAVRLLTLRQQIFLNTLIGVIGGGYRREGVCPDTVTAARKSPQLSEILNRPLFKIFINFRPIFGFKKIGDYMPL